MIADIVPDRIACAEVFEDILDVPLYPEELAVLSPRVVDKRRREFTTGRICARRALRSLGIPHHPVVSGENREPIWPPGIVGSITHCAGYRAAVVARVEDAAGIGIDAEPNEPLPDGVLNSIATLTERERLGDLLQHDAQICWDRLLFCIKEATYKTWFPFMNRWLGFEHVDVSIYPDEGAFHVRLLVPGPQVGGSPLTGLDGRFQVDRALQLTAIVLTKDRVG